MGTIAEPARTPRSGHVADYRRIPKPGCGPLIGDEWEVKEEVTYLTSQRFVANGRWKVR